MGINRESLDYIQQLGKTFDVHATYLIKETEDTVIFKPAFAGDASRSIEELQKVANILSNEGFALFSDGKIFLDEALQNRIKEKHKNLRLEKIEPLTEGVWKKTQEVASENDVQALGFEEKNGYSRCSKSIESSN